MQEQLKLLISAATKPIRKSNYPELYRDIIAATSFLLSSAKIKERIYAITHDLSEHPKCLECDNVVKFLGPSSGYREFCSCKCAGSSEKTANLRKTTNLKTYGCESPAQSQTIRDKMAVTTLDRYGVELTANIPERRDRASQTMMAKYGVFSYTKHPMFQPMIRRRHSEKRGVSHQSQTHISESSMNILNNPAMLRSMNAEGKMLTDIADMLSVSVSTVSRYFKHHDIALVPQTSQSAAEREISAWLTELGVLHERNNRSILRGRELDIYANSHQIAIEYCGLYWHSDLHDRISSHYHYTKMDECYNLGIKLITIFEDEWLSKKDIVKGMIKHAFDVDDHRLYARKCRVVYDISTSQAKEFFEHTHIQGWGAGSISIGLEYNNQLVALMSFINTGDGCYELNRFSTRQFVVGAFSKCLSAFVNRHTPNTIISFCDLRWGRGHTYSKAGFKLVSQSAPSYWYIINNFKTRVHRMRYQKKNMAIKLPSYNSSLTERENADANDLFRIWDCGQLKFVWNNPI